MRHINPNIERMAKEFNALVKVILREQEEMAREKVTEHLSIGLPKWLKDELKRDKARFHVPMSTQARAWLLKGQNEKKVGRMTRKSIRKGKK